MTDRISASVHGLPIPERERYLSRSQLAELMGVSVKTIDRWVLAGMPSEIFGARSRRFLASRALAWARTHDRRAA